MNAEVVPTLLSEPAVAMRVPCGWMSTENIGVLDPAYDKGMLSGAHWNHTGSIRVHPWPLPLKACIGQRLAGPNLNIASMTNNQFDAQHVAVYNGNYGLRAFEEGMHAHTRSMFWSSAAVRAALGQVPVRPVATPLTSVADPCGLIDDHAVSFDRLARRNRPVRYPATLVLITSAMHP